MTTGWTTERRETLTALCDTYIAPVRPPDVEAEDPTGFWARRASDLDVPDRVATYLDQNASDADHAGMMKTLDLLRGAGVTRLPQGARERLIRGLRRASPELAGALDAFRGLTMTEFYGRPDPDGHNPNWDQLGYPGPPDLPRAEVTAPPTVTIDEELRPEADVVVVGSGSGGGVIAGELATGGLDVVVLEAGEEPTYPPDELTALSELYWRGGLQMTADGNVAILAGATLGGGSTINWMTCVPPSDLVRDRWARHHGLEGLDGPDFDAHLDAVSERIGVTDEASELNGPNQRLRDGADALGWSWQVARRNADLDLHDPATAGHVGFGDRTGSKLGTLRTYLVDARDAGARIFARTRVERVETAGGHASGVTAIHTRLDGTRVPVRVRARDVVVAAGALETPAVLLRSGIGGPATGRFLRVHPVPNLPGYYPRPQRGWWGPPQTCIIDEHVGALAGHGFLIETPHLLIGISAATLPWRNARDHKLIVGRSANAAVFLAVNRERGAGRVTIDEDGEAMIHYPLDDPFDRELIRRSIIALVRLHAAGGADAIVDIHPAQDIWKRGDDVDTYAERIADRSLGAGGRVLFTAHQMGSARMGDDPESSVADPHGELHDTPGVWIGGTSAFPTAVGSNPMLTCMALARRTAHALLARR